MHGVSGEISVYAEPDRPSSEREEQAVNRRSIRTIAVSLAVIGGLALSLIGVLLFNGDTREALLYVGAGTASLTLVLHLQSLRPRHELNDGGSPISQGRSEQRLEVVRAKLSG